MFPDEDVVWRRFGVVRPARVGNLDPGWLSGKKSVGVTSGASTPEYLVKDLVANLEGRGIGPARGLTVVEENIVFQLPAAFAKDMKAAGRYEEILGRFGRAVPVSSAAARDSAPSGSA